jgi:glycosyltransferase involved in cell wall biosynthesis
MVQRGHQVLAGAPDCPPSLLPAFEALGIAFRQVPMHRTGLNPVSDYLTYKDLVHLFKCEKPDLFFGYTIKPVIYGSLAARRAGVKQRYAMITGLGSALSGDGFKSRLLGRLVRALYRGALRRNQRVFFQNPENMEYFIAHGLVSCQQAVRVNGSGIDLEAFGLAPLPVAPLSFLLIARLLRDKGVAVYAEAARMMRAKYPDVTFRLVGWIDENPNAIRQEELDGWVREKVIDYLGRLDDIRPAMAQSSVYVLPSYYPEGIPRSILEAMAMGRPVITTDTPGCRETVQKGQNGFLIPPRDVHALVHAMEQCILHPDRLVAMGEASRQLAVRHFDVLQVNRVLLEEMGL